MTTEEIHIPKVPVAENTAPVIDIKGLKKSFGNNAVLKEVDLHVNKGENLVVLGRSGLY